MKKLAKLATAMALVWAMVLPLQSVHAFWGGGYWDDGYGWGSYGRGYGWNRNRWGGGAPWGYGYGGYGYGGYGGYPGGWGYRGGYPGWGYYGGWGRGYYPAVVAPPVTAPTAPAKKVENSK